MRKLTLAIVLLIVTAAVGRVLWLPVASKINRPTVTITPTVFSSIAASPLTLPTSTLTLPVSPSPTPTSVSRNALLSVPFTIQAPDGDWSEPWNEGCEEAALLMADSYLKGNRSDQLPIVKTKQQIKDMVNWETKRFGSHKDLTADEIAIVAKEYLGDQSTVHRPATLSDIKNSLHEGRPVIVPAAGRLLENPYFKHPGPPYHVFVITGYENDQFITNENGTRHGWRYHYSSTTLNRALHDLSTDMERPDRPMVFLTLQ